MKLYYNTAAIGHYPVGFAAVVLAQSADNAAKLLEKELRDQGLTQTVAAEHMIEIKEKYKARAIILVNGDY